MGDVDTFQFLQYAISLHLVGCGDWIQTPILAAFIFLSEPSCQAYEVFLNIDAKPEAFEEKVRHAWEHELGLLWDRLIFIQDFFITFMLRREVGTVEVCLC